MPLSASGQTASFLGRDYVSVEDSEGGFQWAFAPTSASGVLLPRLVAAAHGLTPADVGKPINGTGQLLNDTDGAHVLAGLVVSIVDVNTIEYAPPGTTLDIPDTLFSGGISLPTDRFWDWDLSQNSNAGLYVKDPPLDAFDWMTQIVIVNSTGGGSANVTVLDGEIL